MRLRRLASCDDLLRLTRAPLVVLLPVLAAARCRSMASLAPPLSYNNRHRASSTNVRPALTLHSLTGRRRSNSDLVPSDTADDLSSSPPSPAYCSSPLDIDHPDAAMQSLVPPPLPVDIAGLDVPKLPQSPKAAAAAPSFVELYNRVVHLLRIAHKESAAYVSAAPSTPRISLSRSSTSTEETLLPLSSPSVATFADAYPEKPTQPSSASLPTSSPSSSWHRSPSVRTLSLTPLSDPSHVHVRRTNPFCSVLRYARVQVHTPVFFVIAAFPLSTALLLFCMATLPITQAWPRNITDLAQLGRELHGYTQSGTWPLLHVVGVLSVVVAWNHAWSIPGSVLWVRHTSPILISPAC